jgi:hypothetical protein
MKTVPTEVPSSIVPVNSVPSNSELLSRIRLTSAELYRAETALLRGEALADLLLGVARTVKGWVEHHQQHATDPRHLKSAG